VQKVSSSAAASRRSVDEAAAWIDAHIRPLAPETVPVAAASGRILAAAVPATADEPAQARARIDGMAVRADETVGANAYNPLGFRTLAAGEALVPGAAVRLRAGDPLPTGADAVVPFDYVQPGSGDRFEVIKPVGPGHEVEPAGSHYRRGAVLLPAGRRLGAAALGLLVQAGLGEVAVVRQPRVALVAAPGPTATLLQGLIVRDGGAVEVSRRPLAEALTARGSDAVIYAGGSSREGDDEASRALADSGELSIREVALYPGQAMAIGRTAGQVVVFLLPGEAAACLWAYEMIVGRAIRTLAGGEVALPFRSQPMTTARKIVSRIGATEICPVRRVDDATVEPLAELPRESLIAAAASDGFVIVPEASEGFAAGASVTVYFGS
jgi:molybdopterin molybdotransferase